MFIAIIGFRFLGKSTVENYLATKGFTSVRLHDKDVEAALSLDNITEHWRSNFVTTDIDSDRLVNYFIRRPFFMLICIDTPILQPEAHRASPQVKLKIILRIPIDLDLNGICPSCPSDIEAVISAHIYNGTPRGVKNCNDGGCRHCNRTSATNGTEYLCLNAEENALLEAGRDRAGTNATMYCNTCPCLKCTIKIIQSGVQRVVYNLSYKVDDASARSFQEAGVDIFRHLPPPEP
ncbi:hypothetical protein C8R48DRAFT_748601 [Suillus tomentosus]|nr:hypothetical protein C8R48DRAFT_748601 [Suillus tomentosus]